MKSRALWHHQMETFSVWLAFCAGNLPVNSPQNGQWRGTLMFSLICAWTNGWINHRDDGDMRRHPAHYDVTVMWIICERWRILTGDIQLVYLWHGSNVQQWSDDGMLIRIFWGVSIKCVGKRKFWPWISNHIHIKLWDVATNPCPILNDGFAMDE